MAKGDGVKYGIKVFTELPSREYSASELERLLQDAIKDYEPGEFISLAAYDNRTVASAAANGLRRRHGKPDASGMKFECHRVKEKDEHGNYILGEDGEPLEASHVFLIYNPAWVTEDGKAEFAAWQESDKKLKSEQARIRREKREAAKAEAAAVKDDLGVGKKATARK